jgi:undecaprenyl pyrophosphate phosphatase UppP
MEPIDLLGFIVLMEFGCIMAVFFAYRNRLQDQRMNWLYEQVEKYNAEH